MHSPTEFLRFAECLAQKITDETQVRICIGRAYYAAHLSAREKVRPHYIGVFDQGGGCIGEHDRVREMLVDLDREDISDLLFKLLKLRVKADYFLPSYPMSEWSSEIEYAISLCKSILESIEEVS